MEKNKISVVINTYNAEKHLDKVLYSVAEFDEIVVCDMESTDATVEIAHRHGCRVVTFEKGDCTIVEPARQFAIEQATHQWVLVLDADEVIPPVLAFYLYSVASEKYGPAGIAMPRKNYFMGRFMHGCYPDYVLRFFKKDLTQWPPVIHATPKVNGMVFYIPKASIELALEHVANDSVSDIIRKTDTYSFHELSRRRDKNYGIGALIYRPIFRFFKAYIIKKGFLDGRAGLIHAMLDGVYQFVIVAKLLEEKYKRKLPLEQNGLPAKAPARPKDNPGR